MSTRRNSRQFIENIPQNDVTSTLAMLAHSFCYLNSAMNPIIYNHMNSKCPFLSSHGNSDSSTNYHYTVRWRTPHNPRCLPGWIQEVALMSNVLEDKKLARLSNTTRDSSQWNHATESKGIKISLSHWWLCKWAIEREELSVVGVGAISWHVWNEINRRNDHSWGPFAPQLLRDLLGTWHP